MKGMKTGMMKLAGIMKFNVDIQFAIKAKGLPSKHQISKWACTALAGHRACAELTIRIVDENEGAILNKQWRNSRGATNVLSFPCNEMEKYLPGLLGDIALCAPVIMREAEEQGKTLESHWAHMVIHGTLHLLGYDHTSPEDAEKMEKLETALLEHLGYADPYQNIDAK
jgi:probable rRNA maturation factor